METNSSLEWDPDQLQKVDRCPICYSNKRTVLYSNLKDTIFGCALGKWSMFKCVCCGSGYLDPRPTPKSIGKAYESYFTHNQSFRKETTALSGFRLLARLLANGYRNSRYGLRFEPSTNIGILLGGIAPLRDAIEGTYRFLDVPRNGDRLLDVGCGSGVFLRNIRDIGWKVTGLDVDPCAVEQAKQENLDVRLGTIDILANEKEKFDIITLGHVIEHVHDPCSLLATCRELLTEDGRLWLETPNIGSYGHHWFGPHWLGLDPPRHLTVFSRSAIRDIIDKVGFQQCVMQPPRPVQYGTFSQSFVNSQDIVPCFNKKPAALLNRLQVSLMATMAMGMVRFYPERAEFISLVARK